MKRPAIVGACLTAVLAASVAVAVASETSSSPAKPGWGRVGKASPQRTVAPQSAPRIRKAQTLRRLLQTDVFEQIDTGKKGLSPGDRYVFGGPLLRVHSKKRVGFLSGHCTYTNPQFNALAECEVTAVPTTQGRVLSAGPQITAQGWNDNIPGPLFRQAINGGTMQYANVRGELIVRFTDAGLLVIFRLFP